MTPPTSLVTRHAVALRAGTAAGSVLDDLRRLAGTRRAKALAGQPLVFRLLHGDVEDRDHARKIQQLRDVAGRGLLLTVGTNDRTDWYLDPACPVTLLAMVGTAHNVAPCWWRWTVDGSDPGAAS